MKKVYGKQYSPFVHTDSVGRPLTILLSIRPVTHCLRGVSVAFLLRVSCVDFSMSLHNRNVSDAALLLLLLALSGHMYVSH